MTTTATGTNSATAASPRRGQAPARYALTANVILACFAALLFFPWAGLPLLVAGGTTLLLGGILNLFIGSYRRPMAPALALLGIFLLCSVVAGFAEEHYGLDIVVLVPLTILLVLWPHNPFAVFALIIFEWIGSLANAWVALNLPPGQELLRQAMITLVVLRLATFWMLTIGLHTIIERRKFDPKCRSYQQSIGKRLAWLGVCLVCVPVAVGVYWADLVAGEQGLLLALAGVGLLLVIGLFVTINLNEYLIRKRWPKQSQAMIDRTPYAPWLQEDASRLIREAADRRLVNQLYDDEWQGLNELVLQLREHADQPATPEKQAEFAQIVLRADTLLARGRDGGSPLQYKTAFRTLATSRNDSSNVVTKSWEDDGKARTLSIYRRAVLVAHAGRVNCLAFSADGTRLYSAGSDQWLRQWDTATGNLRQVAQVDHAFASLVCSPDNHWLAAGDEVGGWKVYRIDPWELVLDHPCQGNRLTAITFTHNGEFLIVADRNPGVIRWWDTQTWTTTKDRRPGVLQEVAAAAVSPDGKLLALGGSCGASDSSENGGLQGTMEWWDVAEGELRGSLKMPREDVVEFLQYSSDGSTLVSSLATKGIQLWDAAGRRVRGETQAFRGGAVAASHKGELLAVGTASEPGKKSSSTVIVSVPSLKPVVQFRSRARQTSLAFSPADDLLATAGQNGMISLWELK